MDRRSIVILSETDAENILEDIGGWAAGNDNLNIANYQLGLKKIELWITKAKGEKWNSLNTLKMDL